MKTVLLACAAVIVSGLSVHAEATHEVCSVTVGVNHKVTAESCIELPVGVPSPLKGAGLQQVSDSIMHTIPEHRAAN